MSIKNLYTNNNKEYQNLKISNIQDIRTDGLFSGDFDVECNATTTPFTADGYNWLIYGNFVSLTLNFGGQALDSGSGTAQNKIVITLDTFPNEYKPKYSGVLMHLTGDINGGTPEPFSLVYDKDTDEFIIYRLNLANYPNDNSNITLLNTSCVWYI